MQGCVYEELGHTADVGVRVQAADWARLLACAGEALFALMRGASFPTEAEADDAMHALIAVSDAADFESLLVDWLNELLYIHETADVYLSAFDVLECSETAVRATAAARLCETPPAMHIKAVTYHQLRVGQTADGWTSEVFFDI